MASWNSGARSKKSQHLRFPPLSMRAISSFLNASIVTERTNEMWTPSPLPPTPCRISLGTVLPAQTRLVVVVVMVVVVVVVVVAVVVVPMNSSTAQTDKYLFFQRGEHGLAWSRHGIGTGLEELAPNFGLAHCGAGAPQSQHTLLPSRFCISSS